MKKLLAVILVLILTFSLAACGTSGGQSGGNNQTPSASNENDSSSPASDDNESPEEDENSATSDNDNPDYSLADEVIIDNEDLAFTITSVSASRSGDVSFKVLGVNRTDLNLMFSWDNVSVNGYMIDPFFATTIAADKSSNIDISFSNRNLENANITSIDELVFTLRVYDSDDWSAEKLVESEFIVYPTGLNASAIIVPPRNTTANEQVIVDNENAVFIILSAENDPIWGYTLLCYLENKTTDVLMFSWDDVSVNGFMLDPFFAREVQPGKRAYSSISFSESRFEENGISDVEEIEFKLKIYDSNNWSAPNLLEEIFTFIP